MKLNEKEVLRESELVNKSKRSGEMKKKQLKRTTNRSFIKLSLIFGNLRGASVYLCPIGNVYSNSHKRSYTPIRAYLREGVYTAKEDGCTSKLNINKDICWEIF